LILSSRISGKGIICDRQVIAFNRNIEDNPPDKQELSRSKLEYQFYLLTELFNYKPIAYQLSKCRKVIAENKNIVEGNLSEVIDQIFPNVSSLIDVSEKFLKQVRHLLFVDGDAETNKQLQDRIRKASEYFKEKTESQIVALLEGSAFETDNRGLRKAIKDILSKINEELFIKTECLNETASKFKVNNYLDVRARAALKPGKIRLKQNIEIADSTIKHPGLYKTLQDWRKQIADEEGVPLYYVAHQKLLRQIAILLPTTEKQLKAIKGMGSKKLKKYGKELLEMVLEYSG
jgi:superfamily II DNA helicase RecQ